MADFSLKKFDSLAQNLTGKEAAKLVIGYAIKEEEEKGNYENEIKIIRNGLSTSESRQYNFCVDLYRTLSYLFLDVQTAYLQMKNKETQLDKIRYAFFISALSEQVQKTLMAFPIPIPLEEYQQKLEEEKAKRLKEEMSIDELAMSEAYQSLILQGKLNTTDYPDKESLVEAIANTKKSHEEILNDCYKTLGDFERKRLAKELNRPATDITEEEVKQYIETHINLLEKTTPEVQALWEKELASQKRKIQKLIDNNTLTQGENNQIVTESIYTHIHLFSDHWIKRYIEDYETYEIGEEDANGYFHRYVASVDIRDHKGKRKESLYEMDMLFVNNLLKIMQLLRRANPKLSLHEPTKITFANDAQKEAVYDLLEEIKSLISSLLTYKEIIIQIEKNFFDGMEILSRKGLLTYAFEEAEALVSNHNASMNDLFRTYGTTYWNDYEIENFEALLLSIPTIHNKEEFEEMYEEIVKTAKEKSGYVG